MLNYLRELFYYGFSYKIKEEGSILKADINITYKNEKNISEQMIYTLKKLIKYNWNKFEKKSREYDEYKLNIIFLLSFSTEDGFKVEEKTIESFSEVYDNIDYSFIKKILLKKIIELLEEYKVKSIERSVIKIV